MVNCLQVTLQIGFRKRSPGQAVGYYIASNLSQCPYQASWISWKVSCSVVSCWAITLSSADFTLSASTAASFFSFSSLDFIRSLLTFVGYVAEAHLSAALISSAALAFAGSRFEES